MVGIAPFPPSLQFLLGTDAKGFDLLHVIIEGAKWTIGAAICIAALRVICGIVLGVVLSLYTKKLMKKAEALFDSFTIIPLAVFAYFILHTVLVFDNGLPLYPLYQRALFQIAVLALLAVPTVTFYMAKEIQKLGAEEFIDFAIILGGSKFHIWKTHLFPHLLPIFLLVFVQQFVQVLILLMHLGVLGLFFGDEFDSVSHEWSGMIGMNFRSLFVHPWIPLVPIAFFTLSIIAASVIVKGSERSYYAAKTQSFAVVKSYTHKKHIQVKEESFI
ncbi:ABC transporter permease subunit [Bacillus sp. 165]|uniref:ABC transporter permease subunit n=1 Tax=Bacillus sp. 165 TaxID=1529117 RepID=UPI001FFE2025|nr:ABC transporter permease subunit [Bacillus sp. 165]